MVKNYITHDTSKLSIKVKYLKIHIIKFFHMRHTICILQK